MDISRLCLNCFNEKTGVGACPHCGYVPGTVSEEHYYLPEGTILHDRYLVGTVLGHGGFGITYIGFDTKLEKRVAVKEYLPTDISTRVPGLSAVTTFSGEKYDQFTYGLERFVGEAKTLARYGDSPGIVSISDYFNENNTAYIVMEYLDGITLTEYLKRSGGTVSYEETASIVRPVIEALGEVHAAGMIHRDISPDNIFITTNSQVKLLDFGAARHAMGEKSKSLSVILKPGYAPPEQYYARGKQGPWTDVYALAATMYRMLTGENPPEAMERMVGDTLRSLHLLTTRLPVKFADAVMRALSITAEERFQTIAEFEDAMFGEGGASGEKEQTDDTARASAPEKEPEAAKPSGAEVPPKAKEQEADTDKLAQDAKKKKILLGGIAAVAVIALIVIISVTGKQPSSNTSLSSPAATTAEVSPSPSPSPSTEPEPSQGSDRNKIGFYDSDYDYKADPAKEIVFMTRYPFDELYNALDSWAKKTNVDCAYFNANFDNDLFLSQISTYASEGIDGFIFNANTDIYPAINDLMDDLGLPWMPVIAEALDSSGNRLAPVAGTNEYNAGVLMAEYAIDYAKRTWPDADPDEIGMITHKFSLIETLQEPIEGAQDAFIDKGYSASNIYATASSDSDSAYETTYPIISSNANIRYWLICTAYSDCAAGAAQAAELAGVADRCVVTSSFVRDELIAQWDEGEYTCWKSAAYMPIPFYAEPAFFALYAFMYGYATPETIWPDWIDTASGEQYAFLELSEKMIDEQNYKEYLDWVDSYTGFD